MADDRPRRLVGGNRRCDLDVAAVELVGVLVSDCPRHLAGWRDRWLENKQRICISAEVGYQLELLTADRLPDRRVRRLEFGARGRRYLDGLRNRADLQRDVHGSHQSDGNLLTVHLGRFETRFADRDVVDPGRNVDKGVSPQLVGRRFSGSVRPDVKQRNIRSRHHSALRVRHLPGNGARRS